MEDEKNKDREKDNPIAVICFVISWAIWIIGGLFCLLCFIKLYSEYRDFEDTKVIWLPLIYVIVSGFVFAALGEIISLLNGIYEISKCNRSLLYRMDEKINKKD